MMLSYLHGAQTLLQGTTHCVLDTTESLSEVEKDKESFFLSMGGAGAWLTQRARRPASYPEFTVSDSRGTFRVLPREDKGELIVLLDFSYQELPE